MEKNENSIAFELIKEQGKHQKGLMIVVCFLIFCLAFSNMAWLYVWNQYDYTSEYELQIEADENSNIIYQEGKGHEVNVGKDLQEGKKE